MDPSAQAGEITLSEGKIFLLTSEFNPLVSALLAVFLFYRVHHNLMQVLHEDLEN